MTNERAPSALGSLLSAYAGQERPRHRLLWSLDWKLMRLTVTVTEPMIGRIKLAWWSEALTDETGGQGRGEPLIDAMRAAGVLPLAGLSDWLDGWEALIEGSDIDLFGSGRGGGLFHSLTGEKNVPEWLKDAGAVWSLWDLSGFSRDPVQAKKAIHAARRRLLKHKPAWPPAWRPMRIAYSLAEYDVRRGNVAPKSLTPRLYLRLLRIALTAR